MHHIPPRTAFWAQLGYLLRRSTALVWAAGWRLIGLVLVAQLLIMLVTFPVLRWLFAEALRAAGMHGLDAASLRLTPGFPLSMAIIIVIILLAFAFVSLQFTAILELLRRGRDHPSAGEFLGRLLHTFGRLFRPASTPLLAYLFLLLPLTGFGFVSALSSGIAIPPFISGELAKEPTTALAVTAFFVLLALVGVRLAFTMPLFILEDRTGWRALTGSWQLTRGFKTPAALVTAVLLVLACTGLALFILVVLAIVPTALADALAPAASSTVTSSTVTSSAVAAWSFGIMQVLAILVTGLTTACTAGVLLAGLEVQGVGAQARHAPVTPRRRVPVATAVILLAALVAAGLSITQLPVMQRFAEKPSTWVLAHRGFTAGGVENTISALEAAAAAGADFVEMDVMQTADQRFVVMHDSNLQRLAGRNVHVKDLTQAELTAITVRDLDGHEDRIPSLAAYVTRAAELGMPLLIEIKLGGLDTDDHVDQLVAELESLSLLEANLYHSLDGASVERLKYLRPELGVGYTMPVAAIDVPNSPADFLVVEQWSATPAMQTAAERAGLGFFAWTLNDEPSIRAFLRRNINGMVTDHPDEAITARQSMQSETGLADALVDALQRFITLG